MSVIGKPMFRIVIRLTCHALDIYKYHLVRMFVYNIFSKHVAKVYSLDLIPEPGAISPQ